MDYLVSIIIPVYKVEAYIERCLTSVMGQTYHESPIECILVDDCSPDNSIAIAEKLIATYNGIIDFKIIRNEVNGGISVARNRGLEQATGKYIFFLDSDDHLTEDCLQVLLGALTECPDTEVVLGNCYDQRTSAPYIDFNHNHQILLDNSQLLKAFYMGKFPMIAWNALILRELITKNQISFMPRLVHEDNLWTFELYSHVNRFIFIPQITLIYENNPTSIMNTIGVNAVKDLPHQIIIMDELLNSFDDTHTVEYTLFLASFLFKMLDQSKYCDQSLRVKVESQRDRLLKHSIRRGRIILVLYQLWMYSPLSRLFRYKYVRHNFHRLTKVTYAIASFLDFLH